MSSSTNIIKDILRKRELTDDIKTKTDELAEVESRLKQHRSAKYAIIFSKEVIDVLVPEHERTSCSDGLPSNKRSCSRCAILNAFHNDNWDSIKVSVQIDVEE